MTKETLETGPNDPLVPDAPPARIAVMGSCITRDNFNSRFNPRYKQFYSCDLMQNQTSLISLMSEGFTLPAEDYDKMSKYDQSNVRTDLNKEFLEKVVDLRPDYLILDFFADVHFGCLVLADGRYVTNNRWKLWKTGFYKELKARDAVVDFRIERDTEDYFRVWQEAFDRFADHIAETLPDTTVIVHRGHNTDELQLPGDLHTVPLQEHRNNSKLDVPLANELWRRLDDYAAARPGYEVIDLTDGVFPTFDDHPWGPFYVHYRMDYYSRFLTELHKIHLRHRAGRDADLTFRLMADVETLAGVGPALDAEQLRRHLEREAEEDRTRQEAVAERAAAERAAKKTPKKPSAPPTLAVRAKRKIRRGIRRSDALERLFRVYADARPRSGGTRSAKPNRATARPTTQKPAAQNPAAAKQAASPTTFGPVNATIATARWIDQTHFEVTGWVYSKGVPATAASRPTLTLWLHEEASGRRSPVTVEQRDDVEVTYAADDPKIDYRGAGFRAVFCPPVPASSEQQDEQWRLAFELRSGGTAFEGLFAERSTKGSAALLVPSAAVDQRVTQPRWSLREGLIFETRAEAAGAPEYSDGPPPAAGAWVRMDSFRLRPEPEPAVDLAGALVGVEPDGVRFELRGPHGILAIDDVRWEGAAFTADLPLIVSQWGDPPAPLMRGLHELWALRDDGARIPIRLTPDAVQRLPESLPSDRLNLCLQRTERDQPQLQVRTPLRPDEVGKLAQARLNTGYRNTSIVPDGSVYFESFYGRSATDSPRAVHDELVRRGSNRTMYWAVADHSVPVPTGAVPVVIRSREWYDALARCSYFFHNEGTPAPLRKRDDQVVVQTWHGTPLKLLGHDRPFNRNTPGWAERMGRSTAKWDFMIAGNPYSAEIFRHAYAFAGTMLELGYPRNDSLSDPAEDRVRSLRARLGIRDQQKAVLYTPTWRDGDAKVVGYLDAADIARRLGPDWVILVRGHTNTLRNAQRKVGSQVIDVTTYPEVNDLFLAADAMITDYSSTMFDFSVTGKPLLFYVPDLDDYQRRRRGTYFDLGAVAPGPLLTTPEQVVDTLQSVDGVHAEHAERYRAWQQKFNPRDDGQAAGRVIDAVFT